MRDADAPLAQLEEVVAWLGLSRPGALFTRCRLCNGSLEPARPEEVEVSVPARVRAVPRRFRACRSCGRVYWEGSHTQRMRAVLDRVFPAERGGRASAARGG